MSHPHYPQLAQPPKPEFEYLTEAIGQHFKVHHIEGDSHRYAFFTRALPDGAPVSPESAAVDRAFEELRVELKRYSYVPTLQRFGEQGILTVVRIPDPPFRSLRVNWFMFMATLATVQWAGAFLWSAYLTTPTAQGFGEPIPLASAEAMSGGFLYFTLPLLSILGLHEMGHFIVARHYRVRASLPFFIPSIPPLGTFGAFISMRDPLPSRRAIFDIGVSGPLVGFGAACVVTILGILLTQSAPNPVRPENGGTLVFGDPIAYGFLYSLFDVPSSYLHPTSFAGWAGFLVTAFNLIPAAQLDGGHVFYSMIPNRPRRETVGVVVSFLAVTVIAGWGVISGYLGWLLLLIIVLATIRHPPALNQISRLGWSRIAVGICAIMVFVVSFVPAPVDIIDADYSFDATAAGGSIEVPAGGWANASINLTNLGNSFNHIEATVGETIGNYTAFFGESVNRSQLVLNRLEFENLTLNLTLVSTDRALPSQGGVQVVLRAVNDASIQHAVFLPIRSVAPHPGLEVDGPVGIVGGQAGSTVTVPITLRNTGDTTLHLEVTADATNNTWDNWGFVSVANHETTAQAQPWHTANVTFVVTVPSSQPEGNMTRFVIQVREPDFPAIYREVTVEVEVKA